MSKRIGMLLDVDFPPDDRPEKEALSLIAAGFEVFLLCYTTTGKPFYENYKGIHINRFRILKFFQNKLSAAYLILPFYRWIWSHYINKFVAKNKIDILHVHDLPLSDIAYKIAVKHKLKLVLDQHEYWSNWIGNTFHYNTALGKIVNRFSDWKKYESFYLHKADLVITVSDYLRRIYIEDIHIPPSTIISVPNTPLAEFFNKNAVDFNVVQQYKTHFVIFYAGVIDILRGADLIVKALPKLKHNIPSIKFVLAGRMAKGCNILELAESLGVREQVEFIGWIKVKDLPSYISASKICAYTPPMNTSVEINNTIHTKLYQYVAMEKPIIISQVKMMKDFITQNHLGLALEENSPDNFADKVITIYDNYSEFTRTVANGVKQLKTKGNLYWDQTVQPMITFYRTQLC